MQSRRIAVIGTGYVGTVTATCFAWLGHQVKGIDHDISRIGLLKDGRLPFFEPGLQDLLDDAMNTGRLAFTSDLAAGLEACELIILCIGTPPGPDGLPDLSSMEAAVRALASHMRHGAIIVNKSTVPVGSGNWIRTLLEDALPQRDVTQFSVVSNPEFLREGSAIEDFLYPDRLVLGGDDGGLRTLASVYERVLDQDFVGGRPERRPQLILTDLASAEMIKYAANAFLATKVSFANEIAAICELVGADVRQVLPAIGADHRIGSRFLAPGAGWGGSCFGKDVSALVATGLEYGHPSALLRATLEVNEGQRAAIVRKLQQSLKVLKGRRIGLLGLAFKPGTDDTRDSPALAIARRLLAGGASVTAYDPVVRHLPTELSAIRVVSDPYAAADRADAVVLVTEWPELVYELNFDKLASVMTGNVLVDARNVVDTVGARDAGFRVFGVGW